MSPRLFPIALALGLAFQSAAPSAQGSADDASPRKEPPARMDLLGDPLPPGVVAHLGTSRLYEPGAFAFEFSPDGKTLAALDDDGALRLWDVDSGRMTQEFAGKRSTGHSVQERQVAFSADGKLVAFIRPQDNTVHVGDVGTGQERLDVKGLQGATIVFGPTARSLVVGGNGSVQVWDLEKGAAVARWNTLTSGSTASSVYSLACAADGTVYAAGGVDQDWQQHALWHWKVGEDKELSLHVVDQEVYDTKLHGSGNYLGVLSPNGSSFALLTRDGKTLRVLDPATGKEIGHISTQGQTIGLGSVVRFSGDGRVVTTCCSDGTARVWEAATGKLLHEFKALSTRFDSVALSRDGRLLALMGRADQAIHLWDVAAPRELHSFGGHRSGPLTVAFSRDGKTAFTASRDWKIGLPRDWADWSLRQWDPATGKELHVTRADLGDLARGATFSADGRFLATFTNDGTLRLWDAPNGKEIRRWQTPMKGEIIEYPSGSVKTTYPGTAPVFAPDGNTLFAACGPNLYRWDVNKGEPLAPLQTPGGSDFSLCFPSPDDNSLLVTEDSRRTAPNNLVERATGKVVRKIGNGPIRVCAFSPDGKTVAVEEGLWEAASGRARGRVLGRISALAFSPDGRLLAAGGNDAVRLWDLASDRQVGRLDGTPGRVECLAFSPDGKWLAAAGWSNTVLICDVAALTAGELTDKGKLADKDLDGLWDDLASSDGERAFRAVHRLAAAPAQSVPLLKKRLKSAAGSDDPRIAILIADLDSDNYDVREKALTALGQVGPTIQTPLRRALEGQPSAEVRARAALLLQKWKDPGAPPPPSRELVVLRILEVFENSGTPEAVDVLRDLAKGSSDDVLMQQAKAALDRLARRGFSPP